MSLERKEACMPYYNLLVPGARGALSTPANSRAEALAIFGKEIRKTLSLEGEAPAPYLLDEWEVGPHWINPTILVFTL